jgi:hypothetical protein
VAMSALISACIVLCPMLSGSIDPLFEALQSNHVLRRLDAHPHLVAVVGTGEAQAVGG